MHWLSKCIKIGLKRKVINSKILTNKSRLKMNSLYHFFIFSTFRPCGVMIQLARKPDLFNEMVKKVRPWPRPLHFFSRGQFRNQTNKSSKFRSSQTEQ